MADTITKGEVDYFSYGACMWFALAAHRRHQWPLEAVLDEDGYLSHAWVRLPSGETFDVAGINGAEDFIVDPSQIVALTQEELIRLSGNHVNEEDVKRATDLLIRMGR